MNVKEIADKLQIDYDEESITIYIDNGEDEDITPYCYWHTDEIIEDSTVFFSVLKAVELFFTDKIKLVELLQRIKRKGGE